MRVVSFSVDLESGLIESRGDRDSDFSRRSNFTAFDRGTVQSQNVVSSQGSQALEAAGLEL